MSSRTVPVAATLAADPPRTDASGRALMIGLAGIVLTILGAFVSGVHLAATGWLVGLTYWTAAAIGFLMLTMILHIFDAMWATVLRRQFEHGLAAFPWLLLLFVPLILVSCVGPHHDAVWGWMSPNHLVLPQHKTVSQDVDYAKKSGFLNFKAFVFFTVVFFGLWTWLSARLRKASFAQDVDGDPKWTVKNRFTSGMGIPIGAITLTAAAIYWIKSLEFHWFSTMYGVWYFADCMRLALCFGVVIMVWLYRRGDYQGVLNRNHFHSIGQLMLAFTVFWAYTAFAQYFLIWNANVPEETFWFNEREFGDWLWVGMFLVFVHFLLPFCLLLSYRFKVTHHIIRRIAFLILTTVFVDLCWNILPAIKDPQGNAMPFLSMSLVWSITSMIGVGGICVWAYLRSMTKTKLIPIKDPRIGESLLHHDDE